MVLLYYSVKGVDMYKYVHMSIVKEMDTYLGKYWAGGAQVNDNPGKSPGGTNKGTRRRNTWIGPNVKGTSAYVSIPQMKLAPWLVVYHDRRCWLKRGREPLRCIISRRLSRPIRHRIFQPIPALSLVGMELCPR